MSPELKDYYSTKQRKMAFYIAENDLNNEENPPDLSALMGLETELHTALYAAVSRAPLEKPGMTAGIIVNRDINSTKKKIIRKDKENDSVVRKVIKRDGMYCPNLPTQWRNNTDIIIPKAEFGHFSSSIRM